MIGSWLTDQGLTLGPALALLLFLAIFVGVLAWIYRPGSATLYEHEARLPFEAGPAGLHETEATARED